MKTYCKIIVGQDVTSGEPWLGIPDSGTTKISSNLSSNSDSGSNYGFRLNYGSCSDKNYSNSGSNSG